jgi:Thioredoxin domain
MADDLTFVRIGKNLIGLSGLKEIFQELASRAFESPAAAQEELLRQAAKANYMPSGSRDVYGRALWQEFQCFLGEATEAEAADGLEIKVLGLGCSGCQKFYQQVVDILAARAITADLQYITAQALLKDYDVRSFPALIINGRLVLAGQSPAPAQLEKILLAHAGPDRPPEPQKPF